MFPISLRPKTRKAISPGARWDILSRDGFRCRYCGSGSADTQLHIDHWVPVSKHGTNDPENLITSCVLCNLGKSGKMPGGVIHNQMGLALGALAIKTFYSRLGDIELDPARSIPMIIRACAGDECIARKMVKIAETAADWREAAYWIGMIYDTETPWDDEEEADGGE